MPTLNYDWGGEIMNTSTYAYLLTVYRAMAGEECGYPETPARLDTPAIDRRFWLDVEREFGPVLADEFLVWLGD